MIEKPEKQNMPDTNPVFSMIKNYAVKLGIETPGGVSDYVNDELTRMSVLTLLLSYSSDVLENEKIGEGELIQLMEGLLWSLGGKAAFLFSIGEKDQKSHLMAKYGSGWAVHEKIYLALKKADFYMLLRDSDENYIEGNFTPENDIEVASPGKFLFIRLGERGKIRGALVLETGEEKEGFSPMEINLSISFCALLSSWQKRRELEQKLHLQTKELDAREFRLFTVYQVSKALGAMLEIEEVIRLTSDMLVEVMNADLSLILLMNEEGDRLEVAGGKHLEPGTRMPEITIDCGDDLPAWLEHIGGEGEVFTDFSSPSLRAAFPGMEKTFLLHGIQMAVPMIHKHKLLGFLALGKKFGGASYNKQDIEFMSILGPLAANAISNAQLYELSILDGTTRLFMMRYFKQRCREELKHAARYKKPLAIIMWDIDFFKDVNDTYGHIKGDEVLRKIGQIFKKGTRPDVDVVARYGGEEFIMMMPRYAHEQAVKSANDIRETFGAYPFLDGAVKLTISGGVAMFPEDGSSYDELIECADDQLYRAKRGGRNNICCSKKIVGKEKTDADPKKKMKKKQEKQHGR
ncbi:MAG: GGDEF domain-containing protein [Chloroflexi bacterium]|nr:GGDEF domain-containing protein [Chloroflexota bacterium]